MALDSLLSQGLLALHGLLATLPGTFSNLDLALALGALLLALIHNLLLGQRPAWLSLLPLLVFVLLALPFQGLHAYIPLMLYLFLALPGREGLALLLALPILAHPGSLSVLHLLPGLVLAALLARKDRRLQRLHQASHSAQDALREHSFSQQRELQSLQRSQEDSIKLALMQERNRIARDIHDNVGHILSRALLQLGALSAKSPQGESREELLQLKTSLNAGMDAIRSSVHNTRQDLLHLETEIKNLLEGFSFCPVHFSNSSTSPLSLNHKYVLMAIIREGLSNIMRHSNATQASIALSQTQDSHLLLISDNGSQQKAPSGGMGLDAMQERVRALGGSMHKSASPRGFRLLVKLPLIHSTEDSP